MTDKKYDNSGALFKNDRRQNDKQPEYSGNLTINGVEYWLSAWVKEGKSGKFFSLSVKPKEAKSEAKPAPRQSVREEMSDEIPF